VRILGLFVMVGSILASVLLAACTSSPSVPLPSLSPSPASFTPEAAPSPVSLPTFSPGGTESQTPVPVPTFSATVTVTPIPVASPPVGAGPLLQPESCVRVGFTADGNVGPLLCHDGHPNAYAMPVLTKAAPHMMALGEFATPADVSAAACADLAKSSTGPIEESAYKFMRALNGWSFAGDPTKGGNFKFCH
jgi:hypothetical protein